jgi:YggT family protein
MIPCQLYTIAGQALQLYFWVLLVYALVSWVPSIRGAWTDVLARLVEPVLQPVRRMIPPLGGFDIAFLIVIFLVQMLSSWFLREGRTCTLGLG